MLSIGVGRASELLHNFWDAGYKRMPPRRRAALFTRVLGMPGGDAAGESNDEFAGLFASLASAIAEGPEDAVAPAAVALRDNLAEHTDETTSKAAVELRAAIEQIAAALSDLELRKAYRADDMWELVDNVLTEWGTPADVQGAHTRASAGAAILRRLPELAAGEPAGDDVVAAAKQWLPANSPAA